MMICPNCKDEIADNLIYCTNCGHKLSDNLQDNSNTPSQQELAASEQVNPKKTFKKTLPFVIGGVVLAAAATVFCCLKFATADFIHFFMGDTRYAAAFAKGTVTALADNDYIDSALMSELSSSFSSSKNQYDQYEQYIKDHPDSGLSYREYEEILSASKLLSSVKQLLPENGIYFKAGIKTEPETRLYKLAAEALNMEREDIEKAFEDLDSFALEGKLSVEEEGLYFSHLAAQRDESLSSGNAFYDTKEGSLYYFNSDIYSTSLRCKAKVLEIDAKEYIVDKAKTERERNALIKQLADIYSKHLKNAKTEYSDIVESIGDGEFRGKSMAATFENEILIELFRDITNSFYDSDYFTDILKAAFDGAVPDNIDIDGLKKRAGESLDGLMTLADKLSLTLEFYINTDNSFAGLTLITAAINGNDSYTTQIKYINTRTDIYAEAAAGDNTYLKIEGAKSSDKAGTMEISVNIPKNSKRDKEQNLEIAIEYSDLGHKSAFGKRQLLGNFSVKVSGSLLDELSLRSDAVDYGSLVRKSDFTVSARDSGGGIEYGIDIKNKSYGNVSVTVEIGENTEPVFDRRGLTLEDAVNMEWDNTKTLEAKTSALKHIRELCGKSELVKVCFKYALGKDYIESIDEKIEKLENDLKYKAIYSNYDENKTAYYARIDAHTLYKSLTTTFKEPLKLKSKEPITIKVYYDIIGTMNIIDMAEEDESLLKSIKNLHWHSSSYKNLYVEINYCYNLNQYAPVGVTVVMTDNRDNIPEKLPSIYNYTYKFYPWENDLNYIDPYVVGTYPDLKKVDPGYEEELKLLSEEVDRYNEYAQKGFEAFNSFLKDTGNSLVYPDNYEVPLPIELMIQSGEWSEKYKDCLIVHYFKNSFEKENLYKYLKENAPEIKDGYLILYIYDNKIIGASFSDIDYKLCSAIYLAGATSEWGIIDGITDSVHENWNNPNPKDYAIGTYPVIKSYDGIISEEVTELMTGNWVRIYGDTQTITITEDDIKHITKITSFTNGNLGFKFSLDDGTVYYIHLNITGLIFYEDKPYYKAE